MLADYLMRSTNLLTGKIKSQTLEELKQELGIDQEEE
jgi:hypothetical protein